MAYDAFSESLKLLTNGLPDVLPVRLSRRRRFSPLSFDVSGDVAATLFVRRGVSGEPWLEACTLERIQNEWRLLGGGSGNLNYDPLGPRPAAAELGAHVVRAGGGWTRRRGVRWFSLRARGVSYAKVRVSANVHSLTVKSRTLSVPSHGHQVVVWAARRAPTVEAWSSEGELLATIDLAQPLERA